ncbi:MAG: hypothetical protein JWN87_1969 [Frankiales bacterium]|nr:hypothetical protein [Frankiales bacterium]
MTTATGAHLPQRADGVQLLGELAGSGYQQKQSLVRRADGQTVQLTPLLYQLLEELDGGRTVEEVAAALSARVDKSLDADDVAYLLEDKLRPLGLLVSLDGTEAVAPKANPLLGLRCKVVVSDPAITRRITAPFAWLFHPVVLFPVLAAFVAVCWFVLVDKGLASATRSAFETPGLLLAVFALTVLSAGFHEFGHAAACRYGGATPGAMGAALYLVFPAFYTDVDDSYRLNRRGRLRVDLGGLYFNALVAVAVTGLWLATRQDALLLGVATQLLQMLRQLAPVIRADGYHILADLTGVPDLFSQLGPTLRRLLPSHWGEPSPLTRRARLIVTAWVLVVVPVLVSMLLTAVLLLPRLAATAWTSGQVHAGKLVDAAEQADLLGLGAGLLKIAALALPVLATTYMLVHLVRRTTASTWKRTQDRPAARSGAVLAGLLLVALLGWAWWPSGQYQPVRGDERGTLTQLVGSWQGGTLRTAAASEPVRVTQQPALALVPRQPGAPVLLLVRDGAGHLQTVLAGNPSTAGSTVTGRALPFALPKAPGKDDNQALSVNTADGRVVYDVAYALVTVTDGRDVTSTNSAYALASCTRCATVAVAFQVVLVLGQSDIVPVNAAVAGNRNCVQCLTAALAVQLVATLERLPDAQVQAQLTAAMSRLGDVAAGRDVDIAAVYAEVKAVEAEVLKILQDNGLVSATTTTIGATPSAIPATSSAPGAVASTPAATAAATPAPTAPTAAPAATPPTPTPSASPTPTPSG